MSRAKAKGTRFETDVVEVFRAAGFPYVERRASNGTRDRGDLTGLPGWVVECKNTTRIDLGEFMAETEVEAKHAGCADHALIVKRRMRPARDAYAVVPLWLLADLIAHDGRPEGAA